MGRCRLSFLMFNVWLLLSLLSQGVVEYLCKFKYHEFVIWAFPGSRYGHIALPTACPEQDWPAYTQRQSTLQLLDSLWQFVAEQHSQRHQHVQEHQAAHGVLRLSIWAIDMLLNNLESANKYAIILICQEKNKVRAQVCALDNFTPDAGKQEIFTVLFDPKVSARSHAPAESSSGVIDDCSCGRWRDIRFPCVHTCAVMRATQIGIKSKIDGEWESWATGTVYYQPMHSVRLEDLVESDILPPQHR